MPFWYLFLFHPRIHHPMASLHVALLFEDIDYYSYSDQELAAFAEEFLMYCIG